MARIWIEQNIVARNLLHKILWTKLSANYGMTYMYMCSTCVPVVSSYACDMLSGDCKPVIAVHTYILGLLLGVAGLFLCYLAHRFFHLGN